MTAVVKAFEKAALRKPDGKNYPIWRSKMKIICRIASDSCSSDRVPIAADTNEDGVC